MPLHDVGYRAWDGGRVRGAAAAVIAGTGLRLAWKSRWLRRVVIFAWSPALLFAIAFFAFEQAVEQGRVGPGLASTASADEFADAGKALAELFGGPIRGPAVEPIRRQVWSRLLLIFMRAPQAVLLAIVIGLVAPPLISRDLRARAWLFYFTRPLTRWGYLFGKAGTLVALVALITVLPALALWVVGVAVSPSLRVALATWDMPLRIVAASAVLAAPTVLLALAYSSLTAESRLAAFAWFATWAACWIAHTALTGADLIAAGRGGSATAVAVDDDPLPLAVQRHPVLARLAGMDRRIDRWSWVSLYHALGVVQAGVFGIERRPAALVPPALALAAVSAVSLAVLARRVDAPARA
jgi:ABC-2 type transport system permease protein